MKYLKKSSAFLLFYTLLASLFYDSSGATDYFTYYFVNLIVLVIGCGITLLVWWLWTSEDR